MRRGPVAPLPRQDLMNQPTFTFGDVGTAAKPADDLVKDTTTQTFAKDVLDASREVPVLVDFWAPWCEPCKQLAPVLEKVVKQAGGRVRLVKMNIDEHPQVAGQLGIQSIPAVVAFKAGRPLDGFMGALPESRVLAFIERVVGPLGPSNLDEVITAADAALAEGDVETAIEAFAAVLGEEPDHLGALTGLVRAYVAAGALDQAKETLALVPEANANDPLVAAARAQIALIEQSAELGEVAELERRIAADPADSQARFDLALALNARGERKPAVDALIEIVRRDRAWNEEGARKQLLQFFDAWGMTDAATLYGRRRLSSVLFS